MTVEVIPLRGIPEVRPGDDLSGVLIRAISDAEDLRDGDVVAVTQKIVSKAEGRLVDEEPDGKAAWVARETARVVARRGDLVIAETRHGFVCANAGVDASNVGGGKLSLLPVDPDGSAEALRSRLADAFAVGLGVVITDTFGRPWRNGLVNVAIGCAGLPSLVDLRGTPDANGRTLDVTVVAVADEVAAASGLVIGKADRVPAAIVRGLRRTGPALPASALIRPPADDLFREAPLTAVAATGDGDGGPAEQMAIDADAAVVAAIEAARGSLGARASAVSLGVAHAGAARAVLVSCRGADPDGPVLAGAAAQSVRISLRALGVPSTLEVVEERPNEGGDGWRPAARVRLPATARPAR